MRWALVAVIAVVCWHAATVRANYGGNWTGLWCTGALRPVPPEWQESTYRFPDSSGYDGQLYRLVAHDPLFRKGYARYVDEPGLRYGRILVPLIAYTGGWGNPLWIDRAYYLTILFFIGLGTFWISRWFEAGNWRGWLGLTFLLVPATFVSVDRLTVDVALAALLVGFVFVFDRDQTPTWKLWVIVALACLVRETGILLAVACVVWLLTEKRFRSAVVFGAAALPAVAWYIYVRQHTGPFDYPSSYLPFRAMLEGLLHVEAYGPQVPFAPLIQIADTFAVLAMVAAVLLAVRWIPSGLKDPVKLTGLLFGLLSVLLQQNEIWLHVYGFGRVYTPLILLLAMDSIRSMRFIGALPWAMLLPRMLITVGTQVVGIARAIAS